MNPTRFSGSMFIRRHRQLIMIFFFFWRDMPHFSWGTSRSTIADTNMKITLFVLSALVAVTSADHARPWMMMAYKGTFGVGLSMLPCLQSNSTCILQARARARGTRKVPLPLRQKVLPPLRQRAPPPFPPKVSCVEGYWPHSFGF